MQSSGRATEEVHGFDAEDRSHPTEPNMCDVNRGPAQQQVHSNSLSNGGAKAVNDCVRIVHRNRRPTNKRIRPQMLRKDLSPTLSLQATDTTVSSHNSTSRQPETLQEDLPLPGRVNYRGSQACQSTKTAFFQEQGYDRNLEKASFFAMSVAEEEPLPPSVSDAVAPPRLQRNKTAFFPLKWEHQALVEERSIRARKTACQDLVSQAPPPGTLSAFLSSLPGAGKNILSKKVVFKECVERNSDEEEEHHIGDYELREMFMAVHCQIHGVASTCFELAPPQLTKTESESMCTMMENLFDPSSRDTSVKSILIQVPAVSTGEVSLRRYGLQTRKDPINDLMEGAFSTMQQEIIATPKRSFPFKGCSFSSFASSASGSSRSSCVTPSPAKRMMTCISKRDSDVPAPMFTLKPSRGVRSLEGLFENAPPQKGHNVPKLPEVSDSVNALTSVSRQYWLTEQQKVERAKRIINIPPKLKPKLPPRHVRGTLSEARCHRKKEQDQIRGHFGHKRSISDEARKETKIITGNDSSASPVTQPTDGVASAMGPNRFHPAVELQAPPKGDNLRDCFTSSDDISPDFIASCKQPLVCPWFRSNPPSHVGSKGSRGSRTEHQQRIFNPYETSGDTAIFSDDSVEIDPAIPSSISSGGLDAKKTPQRISQF
ncbi:hypothetical protein IV203_013619 [Nitzschia inconspicua]|uniref:Uncharacterized protein n=1 Tax=Nitzschia inconspicua TaxID=303405 RepID=A0A9K3M5F2_9STRA|nr:hypothetical protein IV203_013619 [Nitzschia inconspicua]